MSEYTIGHVACGSIVGLALAAWLYMLGGRNNKAIRRFGAPAILTLTVCLAALAMGKFSWWLVGLYPLKVAEFVQGYSNRDARGWVKRLGIVGTSLLSGIFLCIVFQGGWFLLFPHAWVGLITITFAFKNPIAAAAEEPLVCVFNNIVTIFYPFVI